MRRKLTITAIVLALLLILVPLAVLSWITYTESGLAFALNRLPAKIGRTELKIAGVRGTLASGLEVDLVEIEHPRSHLKFERVRTEISLLPLLWQSISAKRLDIERALIEVRPRTLPLIKYEPRFLPRLLSISGERVNVLETTIVAPSGRSQVFRDTSASGVARWKTIRFYDAKTTWNNLELDALGTLTAADPMQLEGKARFVLRVENQPEWRAAATFNGDLSRLPLEGTLDAPFRAAFKGSADTLTTQWKWSAGAKVIDFDLRTFGGGGALGIVSGELQVGGDAQGFFARGALTPAGLRAGAFETEFAGSFAEGVVTAKQIVIRHRGTGSRIEASGDIGIEQDGPRLGLKGTWRDFAWPWTGAAETFRSSKGEFSLAGLQPYLVEAGGDLLVPSLAAMPFRIRGRLAGDHLEIGDATINALGGTAKLMGEARWQPMESWRLAGSVAQLNPAAIRPGFPGALDFQLNARGAPFSAAGTIDVEVRNLTGKLRGNPARGSGKFRVTGDDWTFDAVRFQAGNTRVLLDGTLTESPNLRFTVLADNLGLLAEGARGTLEARGELSGMRSAPIVKFVASGTGIDYDGIKIGDLAADVDVDWRGTRASRAKIAASGITYRDRAINQLELALDGSTREHSFTLSGRAAKVIFGVGAAGTFADGSWRGMLRDLSISDGEKLKLTLEAPAPIAATATSAQVESLCLKGQAARLCAQGSFDAARWSARVTANELPMSALTAGLTPDVRYEGTLGIIADVGAATGAPWQGEVRADLSQAALRHKLASGRVDVLRLGSGLVAVRALAGSIDGELKLDAGERGTISGTLRAERIGTDPRRWPLRGALRAATGELGFITLYAPEIDRAAGRFDADIVIEGVATAPQLSGVMKLTAGELDFYQVNLALRAIDIEARLLSNNLEFTSRGKAGEGSLLTDGKLEWRESLPYGTVRFKGENLRVVNVPEARIDASPDLEFRVQGRRILAVGEVNLPYAKIAPADLTGAVLASPDEVIVGARVPDPSKRFEISSQIKMSLGDDVTVDTSGLSGRLTGSITARTTADDVSRAIGELQVEEGKYTAYGRKLDIQRGRLIFSGGLLADPAVDIRAVKQFPDVVAGIHVRGSLRQPRLTYFSEPALPQSQIVSLILAGGGLEAAQAANRQGTGGARQEALAQGAALLAQPLGERLGIEDVSVESNLANETSLVLGKYLSPRLYVSYGISLTESINTLKMRYTISDKWTVKTEAGKERSADLVYTIEK